MSIKAEKELSDLLQFIKKCKKIGLTRIKLGDVEVEFTQEEKVSSHRPKRNANAKALAKKQDGVNDDIADEDLEFQMAQLRINDPEAYEEFEIKRMRGDGQ